MLKDINSEEVEDIAIAVVPGEEDSSVWEVYMINLKEEGLDNVIVASKGYGMYKGEEVKTSVLRHFLGAFEPLDIRLIEPIQKEVFGLNNEYWVSFYIGKNIYDKKFIFLPESISEDNFTRVPFINRMGVIIR
ncbi:MAG: hypothetical protein RL516_83 [Bacteroidota bacterium]|jgi:hypothetical protein